MIKWYEHSGTYRERIERVGMKNSMYICGNVPFFLFIIRLSFLFLLVKFRAWSTWEIWIFVALQSLFHCGMWMCFLNFFFFSPRFFFLFYSIIFNRKSYEFIFIYHNFRTLVQMNSNGNKSWKKVCLVSSYVENA